MSVTDIIKHSVDKNPLAMKEALEAELAARIRLALEAKMSDDEDEEDEEDEDDEEEDDDSEEDKKLAKEEFDLSDLTLEELEGFMESAEFDQLDELDKKTLASYVKKASKDVGYIQRDISDKEPGYKSLYKKKKNRIDGVARAVDRLTK